MRLSFISRKRALPAFYPTFGFSLFYISLLLLIPLAALVVKSTTGGFDSFIEAAFSERAIEAYKLSFGGALLAATINAVFGFFVAWVLARYDFFGKTFVDTLVDLPFALPTAIAGISLTALLASGGIIGDFLALFGIQGAYSTFGVVVAFVFVGVPFTIRALVPALKELPVEVEEAAKTLGANGFHIVCKVILPYIWIAWLCGFILAFARAVGEYGSIVFISGNLPFKTEVAPLLIVMKLEEYDYAQSASIAVVMLVASFLFLFLSDFIGRRMMYKGEQ